MVRFEKGSPEAVAWGKKMREARGKKVNVKGEGVGSSKMLNRDIVGEVITNFSSEELFSLLNNTTLTPEQKKLVVKTLVSRTSYLDREQLQALLDNPLSPQQRRMVNEALDALPPPPPATAQSMRAAKPRKRMDGRGVAPPSRMPETSPAAEMAGAGVVKDITKGLKKAGQKIKSGVRKVGEVVAETAEDVGKYGKAVIYGRKDYPPKVRNILKKNGDEVIKGFKIKRTPVSKLLTGALSAVSLGEFGKRFGRSEYDDLFHLFLEMNTASGKRISVEKNEVINMDTTPPKRDKEEVKEITSNIPEGLTIDEMMDKAEQYMGKNKFFGYSARDNNCQDFIIAILRANNIGDNSDIQFVKQNTKQLFKNLPFLRKVSNTITDIGARANVITTGAGMPAVVGMGACMECDKCMGMGIIVKKMKGGSTGLQMYSNEGIPTEEPVLGANGELPPMTDSVRAAYNREIVLARNFTRDELLEFLAEERTRRQSGRKWDYFDEGQYIALLKALYEKTA